MTAILSRKEMGVPEVGVRRGSLSSCEVSRCEVKDPKFKHEIFMRIDMKHSYFSNYFIVVEIIIELFLLFAKT